MFVAARGVKYSVKSNVNHFPKIRVPKFQRSPHQGFCNMERLKIVLVCPLPNRLSFILHAHIYSTWFETQPKTKRLKSRNKYETTESNDHKWQGHPNKMLRFPSPDRPNFLEK